MINKINICGYEYTIEVAELVNDTDKDGEIFGHILYKEHKIIISCELCESERQATLLHEIVHAVFFHTGLTEILSGKMNEAIACAIGYQFPKIIEQFSSPQETSKNG